MDILAKIGRILDRVLPGIGNGIQACMVTIAVLLAIIMAIPLIERMIYAGALLWLVCAIIGIPFFLLWVTWKRPAMPRESLPDSAAVTADPNAGVRGKITFFKDRPPEITLTATADASTFMHECAHHWLAQLLADAEHPLAPDILKADADIVRKWLGARSNEDISYNGTDKPRIAAATERHEQFARGFERYLMEGVAPSKALVPPFAQFKQWLTDIYQTVDRLNAPIDDDIRGVFDRLISVAPKGIQTNKTTRPSHQTDKPVQP